MASLKNTLINDTGYLGLPSGTTAQRPSSPATGYMRWNTTESYIEVYDGTEWGAIAGTGAGGGGGIAWETTVQTGNFGATAGAGYFVNTTSAAITVTLPSSPTAGDEVSIVDYAGTADTNNITITSSDNINGSSNDVLIYYERGGVSMVYVDATQGWVAYNAANETATALVANTIPVDYLVVAGGGGAGTISGGGGAGGLRTSYTNSSSLNGHTESSLTLYLSINYTVTVGAGGSGGHEGSSTNGQNSVFSTITSTGGGQGGHYNGSAYVAGSSGGSGGGTSLQGGPGGSAASSPVQGYAGGAGDSSGPPFSMGGGGGAAAVGGNSAGGYTGANGGAGLEVNIIGGTGNYYAGGGGGSGETSGGTGGTGGGGNGGGGTIGTAGSPNTGGGSGGNRGYSAGTNGGSGVVILRYPNTITVTETTSGGNVLTFTTATVGSDKVTTFTAGENGTIQFS